MDDTPTSPPQRAQDTAREITGSMWLAGRQEFEKWARRYQEADSHEQSQVWADVAPAEIYKAMEAARAAASADSRKVGGDGN